MLSAGGFRIAAGWPIDNTTVRQYWCECVRSFLKLLEKWETRPNANRTLQSLLFNWKRTL